VRVRVALCSLAGVALLAGCRGSNSTSGLKAFCNAAGRYETELQREATNGKLDAAKQAAIVQQIVTSAPPSVRGDAQTFLAALKLAQRDPHVSRDPAITKPAHTAADNVNRYASQKCGFFNQQPGGI
jgi:hypothetical protein